MNLSDEPRKSSFLKFEILVNIIDNNDYLKSAGTIEYTDCFSAEG